ncbi:MAG TPA: hypothetical protein ENN17_08450 [bacterium]|nr:hypothetical protein [bacterium]
MTDSGNIFNSGVVVPFFVLACLLNITLVFGMGEKSKTIEPSVTPPGNLELDKIPQFILLGFDDNSDLDPMEWILDFLDSRRHGDGSPLRAIFYTNGNYLVDDPELRAVHLRAWKTGHEIGNHTQNHEHGGGFSVEEWTVEINACTRAFVEAGIPAEAITGFRTPFLEYNAATFEALDRLGFAHDSSIEEGDQADQDGTNFLWPYTLHDGSPGNALRAVAGFRERVGKHPGILEIPIHVFLVPEDGVCEAYGVKPGLRGRAALNIEEKWGWQWSTENGKISGLDWNVLEAALLEPEEFLAILKYNLDLRREGNKAPMMVGGHTALYPGELEGRRTAIENFVDYALSYADVRIITPANLLKWMFHPQPLDAFVEVHYE